MKSRLGGEFRFPCLTHALFPLILQLSSTTATLVYYGIFSKLVTRDSSLPFVRLLLPRHHGLRTSNRPGVAARTASSPPKVGCDSATSRLPVTGHPRPSSPAAQHFTAHIAVHRFHPAQHVPYSGLYAVHYVCDGGHSATAGGMWSDNR